MDNHLPCVSQRSVPSETGNNAKPGNHRGADVLFDAPKEFGNAFQVSRELWATYRRISGEIVQTRKEVTAVLESVPNTAKLVEIWPRVEAYLPPEVVDPDKGVNLPALPISRLDAKLKARKPQ